MTRAEQIHWEASRRTDAFMKTHPCQCYVCYMLAFMEMRQKVTLEFEAQDGKPTIQPKQKGCGE